MKKHNKLLASVFSLLFPGAGYFYIGHLYKAFLLFPSLVLLQYLFFSLFNIYISKALVIIYFFSMLSLYFFSIFHVVYIIEKGKDKYLKINHWYIVLILFIPLGYIASYFVKEYLPIRSFSIPATSMENTLLKGDWITAKKVKSVKRGELSIFQYPINPSIYYIKRCVAIENDEVLYTNKQLLIHFYEGDNYIKKNYPKENIISVNNKLWVKNPYMLINKGIKYQPNHELNSFEILNQYSNYGKPIGMQAIYIEELEVPYIMIKNKKINAYYRKIFKNEFFMMGDNRDNANDSRFWGTVKISQLYAKPLIVYFHISEDYSINWNRIGTTFNRDIFKDSI